RPLVRRPPPPHHQGVKGPVGLRGPAPFRVVQDGAEHVVHRGVGKGERVVHDAEPAREERLLTAVELDGPPRQVVLGLGPRLAPAARRAAPPKPARRRARPAPRRKARRPLTRTSPAAPPRAGGGGPTPARRRPAPARAGGDRTARAPPPQGRALPGSRRARAH